MKRVLQRSSSSGWDFSSIPRPEWLLFACVSVRLPSVFSHFQPPLCLIFSPCSMLIIVAKNLMTTTKADEDPIETACQMEGKVLREGSGWRSANGEPGEPMDRLAVKDQSEKQRMISSGPRELGNRPAAPLIILRSINVSFFIYLFSYLFLKLFIAIIIWA